VANWYKYCVLQTEVSSLQSPDFDTELVNGINFATGDVCVEIFSKNIGPLSCTHQFIS